MRGRDAEKARVIVVDEGIEVRRFLVTDLRIADADETLRRAELALRTDGSSVTFGVRDHDATARARSALARSLITIARPHGARVLVHDRVDLALAVDADGVHLAERSIETAEARALGARYVSRSCHDAAGIAAARGCDAITLSPLFASPKKGEPLGIARFTALARTTRVPVIALGGIDASNAHEAIAAGAVGVAMIRGWLVG